jgi:hypothetical protein
VCHTATSVGANGASAQTLLKQEYKDGLNQDNLTTACGMIVLYTGAATISLLSCGETPQIRPGSRFARAFVAVS